MKRPSLKKMAHLPKLRVMRATKLKMPRLGGRRSL